MSWVTSMTPPPASAKRGSREGAHGQVEVEPGRGLVGDDERAGSSMSAQHKSTRRAMPPDSSKG